ncbi:hypothetical protein GOBAR_DD26474 [Gossypium barbadense]|nr:hypothetical protein GOBAR_DD26474 [Gossypium barbadense]
MLLKTKSLEWDMSPITSREHHTAEPTPMPVVPNPIPPATCPAPTLNARTINSCPTSLATSSIQGTLTSPSSPSSRSPNNAPTQAPLPVDTSRPDQPSHPGHPSHHSDPIPPIPDPATTHLLSKKRSDNHNNDNEKQWPWVRERKAGKLGTKKKCSLASFINKMMLTRSGSTKEAVTSLREVGDKVFGFKGRG